MIRKGTGSLKDQNSKLLKSNNSEKMENGFKCVVVCFYVGGNLNGRKSLW
jgi:hypothetical protein